METGKEVLVRAELDAKSSSREEIEFRYLAWTRGINCGSQYMMKETDYLAKKIVGKLRTRRMSFKEACIVIGYVRTLLNIENDYINGIDEEGIYIKYCLNDELIELAKNIADYIENQDEVRAHIPATFDKVYIMLREKMEYILLW